MDGQAETILPLIYHFLMPNPEMKDPVPLLKYERDPTHAGNWILCNMESLQTSNAINHFSNETD